MLLNVALAHTLRIPDLAISATAGIGNFSFQPLPAHTYDLEKYNATTNAWDPVTGQTSILGPDPFSYTVPAVGAEIFRCAVDPHYTEIVTPPSS